MWYNVDHVVYVTVKDAGPIGTAAVAKLGGFVSLSFVESHNLLITLKRYKVSDSSLFCIRSSFVTQEIVIGRLKVKVKPFID